MSDGHTITDDIVFDMVSVQYHALRSADALAKYVGDAHEHTDVAAFLQRWCNEDRARAEKCQLLIRDLLRGSETKVGAKPVRWK